MTPEQILEVFAKAGMNLEPSPNALYTVRGQHAQLINGARALLAASAPNPSDKQEAVAFDAWAMKEYGKQAVRASFSYDAMRTAYAAGAAPIAQSAEQDRIDAERRDAIYRKALAMGDAPDTIGPDTHEHHFEVEPSSGIELCTYCKLSRVAAKGASK